MPVRAILFDHDGTLVDSYPGIARCMRLTCRDLGKPEMTEEEVRGSIGPTLEDRFAELWGEGQAAEATRIYRAHYAVHFLTGTRLLEGVKPTLEALAARGVPMACVTNKSWDYCVRQLEHFGLLGWMRVVYGNRQGFPPKPDPAMALAALEVLGVPPGEAVLVGDTAIDVRTARSAGVQAWVVPSEYTSREAIKQKHPHKMLENFEKILQYI